VREYFLELENIERLIVSKFVPAALWRLNYCERIGTLGVECGQIPD
jgi:hypothetical protein